MVTAWAVAQPATAGRGGFGSRPTGRKKTTHAPQLENRLAFGTRWRPQNEPAPADHLPCPAACPVARARGLAVVIALHETCKPWHDPAS